MCLDVCLANQSIFVYEITKEVVLITVKLCNAYIRKRNIKVYFFFQCLGYCFEVLGKKLHFCQKFCYQFQNLRLGVCLAKCLKFPEFEAGCAYELYAYKEKRVKELNKIA